MMATVVQAAPTVASAQARTLRAITPSPPPSGLMHTRPWRSSPLAGPVFSTLPPVIPESSEESHELHDIVQEHPRTRSLSSSSIASQSASLSISASGYTSRNASVSASALFLVGGDASTSSVSLGTSTGAQGTSESHGHSGSQTYPNRPKHLSKSWRHRPSSAQGNYAAPKSVGDRSMSPPPRPRTVSHGHPRPASFPVQLASSPRPTSGANTTKQPPSVSRSPASNWMSSSPFGPAETPKFSRLAMASPAVVMPLSAREYRKQKARQSFGMAERKEPPTSSNRIMFIDNAMSAFQSPNSVPVVKISPPASEDARLSTPSSGDHRSDRRSQSQPQVDHPPSKPLPQASMSPPPSSPKQKRPRSRPDTPAQSSLAVHPPISPKSSAGTFFSFTDTSEDHSSRPHGGADDPSMTSVILPARPRPRVRRKSYPDRLSNGTRLSLLEAMNRLSQEGASLHRLSDISQTDGVNRLSVVSQASGHTLFYDVESDGNRHPDGHGATQCTTVLHTQSLEDLSTLARTGIEVVDGNSGDPLDENECKGKRNVRTVRISDTVEVSPPVAPRRRKLTKSRPGPARGSMPVPGAGPAAVPGMVKEVRARTPTQTHERLVSLLLWKSKGSSNSKTGGASGSPGAAEAAGGRDVSTPPKGLARLDKTIAPVPAPSTVSQIADGSGHAESRSKSIVNGYAEEMSYDAPPTTTNSDTASKTPRRSRRYTFSFFPSATFHRPKREKSNTAPPNVDLGLDRSVQDKSKDRIKRVESGTDSTWTSIRTITPSTQSTLVPMYDLTLLGSSGNLSGSGRGSRSSVPMLRRLTTQEMATASMLSLSEHEGKGDSTPSLITTESTTTSSSSPRTPSIARPAGSGGAFVPRPSGLKESYTDTSEEDSEDAPGGRKSRMCVHRKQEPSPLALGGAKWGETSEEDERHLRPNADALPGSRPGTASSTATETSGSYLSFSTVPFSTTSSSSTSRSESPAPVAGDKLDRAMSMVQDRNGDEVTYACALCGHRLPSPSSLPMRQPDLLGDMHPMFTVPLVTVPASNTGMYPRLSPDTPSAMQVQGGGDVGTCGARYTSRGKNERHASVPVAASVAIVPPARHDQSPNYIPVHANEAPVTSNKVDKMKPSLSRPKASKQRRSQTAPTGVGDAASRFVEDVKTMRAHEGSVDVLVAVDRPAKHKGKDKAGSGESRFKATLKGLSRWTG